MPGRVGTAHATIRLWNDGFRAARGQRGDAHAHRPRRRKQTDNARRAAQDADGAWQVDGIELSQPGNWTVTVDAVLGPAKHLVLDAPIVIEPDAIDRR